MPRFKAEVILDLLSAIKQTPVTHSQEYNHNVAAVAGNFLVS